MFQQQPVIIFCAPPYPTMFEEPSRRRSPSSRGVTKTFTIASSVCLLLGLFFWDPMVGCTRWQSTWCRTKREHPPGPGRTKHWDMHQIQIDDTKPMRVVASAPAATGEDGEDDASIDATSSCGIEVVYRPSPWELEWLREVHALQSDDNIWKPGCDKMEEGAPKTKHWLEYWETRETGQVDNWSDEVFSYHEYIDSCTKATVLKLPLEPLVGALRQGLDVPYSIHSSFFQNTPLCSQCFPTALSRSRAQNQSCWRSPTHSASTRLIMLFKTSSAFEPSQCSTLSFFVV